MIAVSEDWKFARRRERLTRSLRQKGITDEPVLAAMGRVPRHLFVDDALASRAYLDEALPIGMQQTISQPFTVAYQTSRLAVVAGDRVLEVGTGSGYQAAVLCEMGIEVYSVERLRPLYERTRALLHELGYRLKLKCGDGSEGWEAFSPYDGIIVTAGAATIPDALLQQLKTPTEEEVEGGRLIIPVGDESGQVMTCAIRTGPSAFLFEELDDFRFVPLVGGADDV